jgi:hypothetical protein
MFFKKIKTKQKFFKGSAKYQRDCVTAFAFSFSLFVCGRKKSPVDSKAKPYLISFKDLPAGRVGKETETSFKWP